MVSAGIESILHYYSGPGTHIAILAAAWNLGYQIESATAVVSCLLFVPPRLRCNAALPAISRISAITSDLFPLLYYKLSHC